MNKAELDQAREWIENYVDEHGSLQVSTMVELAADPEHTLHPFFTWNDTEAAHQHRLNQGRQLIRRVSVKIKDPIVHVPKKIIMEADEGKQGDYKRVSVIRQHPDEFERAYSEVMTRLTAVHRAIAELETAASSDEEKISIIALASKSLETAREAIQRLH